MMMFQPVCLFVSLLLVVVQSQVLDFTMERAPDGIYCGHLRCVANSSLTIINLAIYDATEKEYLVKLTSIYVFAPEVIVEPSKVHVINATGSISTLHGVLDVRFLRDVDCLYGAFQCELDFININGQPDVIRENLAPATEEKATILYSLTNIATQLTEHSEETEKQLEAVKQDNVVLKEENVVLKQDIDVLKNILDNVLSTVSRIDGSLNSSLDKEQQLGSWCIRGMPHNSPREKFLLQGKVLALCDTETDGGGWVIIQRRARGDVDFYRGWDDYKRGFGTPDTDFWFGNDVIHSLTSQGYNQLRIDFVSNNTKYFAEYSYFVLADESSAYAITVGGFVGNVYDSMKYHNGRKFSTFDRDNDIASGNCAVESHGAWWYNDCSDSNLNGAWGVNDSSVLDFTMERAPDDIYCGHLRCVANSSLAVINLAIYNATEKENPVKIASIYVFDPQVIVDPSKFHVINATGSISKLDGVLDVRFLRDVDCLYGAFQCELDFVNINGQPDVIRENLAPATEKNATVLYSLAKIATQLKEHSEETDKQLGALKQDNVIIKQDIGLLKQDNVLLKQDNVVLKQDIDDLKQDNAVLKKLLDNVLSTVSRIDGSLNSTLDKEQQPRILCYRGMPHNSSREKFILPGKDLALCDTETDGGGWVIIQRRVRGDIDFYRSWDDYKTGFGTPDTDFWIGNDIIHELTSQGYNQLRIDMVYNNTEYFAEYSNFVLADESSAYAITVGGFSGNVYDAMKYSNGLKFSTFDRNNEESGRNCAVEYRGAWWYYSCSFSNLNGGWGVNDVSGIFWYFPTWNTLSFTEMKLRLIEK